MDFDSDIFRKAIQAKGLTMKSFAKEIGVHYTSVLLWANNVNKPTPNNTEKTNKLLGTEFGEAKSGARTVNISSDSYDGGNSWTPSAVHCYDTKQDCENCDSYSVVKEWRTPCQMPVTIEKLLKKKKAVGWNLLDKKIPASLEEAGCVWKGGAES
jgi:transcriptional regulator with XRE-family HTH domain